MAVSQPKLMTENVRNQHLLVAGIRQRLIVVVNSQNRSNYVWKMAGACYCCWLLMVLTPCYYIMMTYDDCSRLTRGHHEASPESVLWGSSFLARLSGSMMTSTPVDQRCIQERCNTSGSIIVKIILDVQRWMFHNDENYGKHISVGIDIQQKLLGVWLGAGWWSFSGLDGLNGLCKSFWSRLDHLVDH